MRGQFLSRGIHLPVEKEDLAGMYKLNNLAQAPFYLAIPPQTQIQFWSDVQTWKRAAQQCGLLFHQAQVPNPLHWPDHLQGGE